uniref:Uncharacterized protein n=1 Tax=Chlamydomonas euryale TaxID=1486919 RepID=A0A7R9V7R0_9CHLO
MFMSKLPLPKGHGDAIRNSGWFLVRSKMLKIIEPLKLATRKRHGHISPQPSQALVWARHQPPDCHSGLAANLRELEGWGRVEAAIHAGLELWVTAELHTSAPHTGPRAVADVQLQHFSLKSSERTFA